MSTVATHVYAIVMSLHSQVHVHRAHPGFRSGICQRIGGQKFSLIMSMDAQFPINPILKTSLETGRVQVHATLL